MDYLKNLLIAQTCTKDIALEITQANDAQINALTEQAKNLETHQIVFLIDKCSEYIKELKLTNNPRLWLEIAIIDLANLTENTKLVELQNRLARLEGSGAAPIKVASYKTAPMPVTKPEIMKVDKEERSTGLLRSARNDVSKDIPNGGVPSARHPELVSGSQPDKSVEEFSPMPKSKPVEGADVMALWGQLLESVQSAPTRALLKQWGNAVKITPDETILTMKSEIFLNQLQSGAKKQAIIQAVDSLFGQSNSNVVIRLPQAGDDAVRQVTTPTVSQKPVETPKPVEPEIEPEEVQEIMEKKQAQKPETVVYSDNVKMVMDLFDGKIIE